MILYLAVVAFAQSRISKPGDMEVLMEFGSVIPNHFVTANIDEMPEKIRKYKDQLDGSAMLVRRAQVVRSSGSYSELRGYFSWCVISLFSSNFLILLPTPKFCMD